MKRLLASGSGPIFQVCKAFRDGEAGRKHNPEFTMLEWYRLDFDHWQLMDEVEELISRVLPINTIERKSYRELFQQYLDIDPHRVKVGVLRKKAEELMDLSFDSDEEDVWLDLLYSHVIEPELQAPIFIYNYPKTQAALAKVAKDEVGVEVAQRFELVIAGIEVANGYFELRDAQELQRRFEADQVLRKGRELPQHPLDQNLLAALQHGLPKCAGVALGLDRLLMLVTKAKSIDEVICFPIDRV